MRAVAIASVVLLLGIGVPRTATDSVSGAGPTARPRASEVPAVDIVPIRALYLTTYVAAGPSFPRFLRLLESTRVNGLVIDLKDANGRLAFRPEHPDLQAFAPRRPTIPDLRDRIRAIHDRHGIAIARIPVFQDTWYAERVPAEALKNPDGSLWRDRIGGAWLDPASSEVTAYAVAIAREAAALGFDEVNLDYIRFPSDGGLSRIRYPKWDGSTSRRSVITAFLRAVDAGVRKRGIPVSVDLFGLVLWSAGDLGIGQQLEDLAPYVDVVAPMVYPSHYRSGFLGKANPAEFPREVVGATIARGTERLAELPVALRPIIRPWIQDFNLGAPYGVAEVRAQEDASTASGGIGVMVWNPLGRYHAAAFQRPSAAETHRGP